MNVQYFITQRALGRAPRAYVKEITYATYRVLHRRLLLFQRSVSPFLHRCIGTVCSPCIYNNLHVHGRTYTFEYYILYHHSLNIFNDTDNKLEPQQLKDPFPNASRRSDTAWLGTSIYMCSHSSQTEVVVMVMITKITSSSLHICHGVGPLVDHFRSHVSRSLFKGLPWFLLPVGE